MLPMLAAVATHSECLKMSRPSNVQLSPALLSTDPIAVRIRDQCDYTKRFSLVEALAGKATRTVRVYADGIYDLFHYGHCVQLQQAKTTIPNTYLLVGVSADEPTVELKGLPVMNQSERIAAVRHCRWVDEVVVENPWLVTLEFTDLHKIDFVAHDDIPYEFTRQNSSEGYEMIKQHGMFLPTVRTDGVSTTEIINRMLVNADIYTKRNAKRMKK